MNEQEQKEYLEEYKQAKEKGVPFYPDILFKDSIVALLVFLLLVALAYFIGAPLEERANPADANYTPRPEWYFLFLFQLLKYFPGELEVIGVVVLPTIAIILLFLLPFLDKGPKRHFTSRPFVSGLAVLSIAGVVFLTVDSVREAPPPSEEGLGDTTAALYARNCAGCHGSTIEVPTGTNLHSIIEQGSHDGMPAWTADLTTDEIDALAGFVLSPAGSDLFTLNCGACHEAPELVAGDPIMLRNVLNEGSAYPAHEGLEIPEWSDELSGAEHTSLLNFLAAPDGQRLFVINCSSCHGRSVAFLEGEEVLRELIFEGGLHLEMPPWREKLTESELDRLALYMVKPESASTAIELYERHCDGCHSSRRIPKMDDFAKAKEIIASGGSHQTMPVWGEVLTTEQLDALVSYTLTSAQGTPLESGQLLYAENCASCHGDFGEGGSNPARPDDVIAPISTAEYLKTRDDFTLRSIIDQGQPNFGMSPFGAVYGGPLDNDDIDSIVIYIRSWQANPPVELPPEVSFDTISLSGIEVYFDVCSQCHGLGGEGDTGPSLRDSQFRTMSTSEDIFNTISIGHGATDMIAWGAVLTSAQIEDLVDFIEQLPIEESEPVHEEEAVESEPEEVVEEPAETPAEEEQETPEEEPVEDTTVSFSTMVFPIMQVRCLDCHGSDGGWDSSTYDLVINSGDHGPSVIPGDTEASLLAQKLLGTHEEGDIMPPPPLRKLSDEQIQVFLDWIAAGAPNN